MTSSFYDHLATHYHLLFTDWEASVRRQGNALAGLLQNEGVSCEEPILDAACGIGTQTLGLLAEGYQVTASDISAGALKRLRSELAKRSLQAQVHVDDLRTLSRTASESMAAVLACDNSVPHLLSDAEILRALSSCHRCLRPGGVLILSVRDYASMPRLSHEVRPYGMHRQDGHRLFAVQLWEWEGDQYDLRLYMTSEAPDGSCHTTVAVTRYYAVTIDRLMTLLREALFVDVKRIDDLLFQPVVMARR
jgi:SAM-dependent methyltransferase